MISRDVEFDEEGVWDFGTDNDSTFIPPFGDQGTIEPVTEVQQEQTTPPTSPTSAVRGSPPSFLNERTTERTRSLDGVYEDTPRLEDLTLFCFSADCEPEEATTRENWRVAMDEEVKAIEKNDTSELRWPQKEGTTICVDNKSPIALSKPKQTHRHPLPLNQRMRCKPGDSSRVSQIARSSCRYFHKAPQVRRLYQVQDVARDDKSSLRGGVGILNINLIL